MPLNPRATLVGAVSVLTLALTPSAALASGGDDNHLIRAKFTPSLPTDPPINGVNPGGLPWVLGSGEVRVRDDGRMDVRLDGLQIPRNGGEDNPVAVISAVLYCGGVRVADSGPQPLTVPEGDARFRVMLTVPEECDMATVLIQPRAETYIASATATGEHHED